MPSKAGSPNRGARIAKPLLPRSGSFHSNSTRKLLYSWSLSNHVPRGVLPLRTLCSTFHLAPSGGGLRTSAQCLTTQPGGTPSSGKRVTARARPSSRTHPRAVTVRIPTTHAHDVLIDLATPHSQRPPNDTPL